MTGHPTSAVFRPTNNDETPHQVEMRLLTDKPSARPGETVRLGVQLVQDKGWHTYWKVNYEVGQPTNIEWKLPAGATHSDYEYPIPQRFELEEIVSYGYDDQVVFFTEVSIPDDATPGPTTLGAAAEWLTCEAQCIPGKGTVELPFEIVDEQVEPAVNKAAALFDHYAEQHPDAFAVDDAPFTIEHTLEPAKLKPNEEFTATFLVKPKEGHTLGDHKPIGADHWPTLLPISDVDATYVEFGGITIDKQDDGSLKIVMKGMAFEVEEPRDLPIGGLFRLEVDGKIVQQEHTVQMPWDEAALAAIAAAAQEENPDAAAVALPTGEPGVDEAACATMIGGADAVTEADTGWATVVLMLLGAFAGGLILNIMPCVLPVLTLKVYGLIEQKEEGSKDRITQGVAYTAGILASFLVLAIAVVIVKVVLGQNVGWGFQFQYPGYVATLAAIVFAFGLSLFGVFEIPVVGANSAASAGQKEGPVGYFMTGVFATLLATPCSAPFLGSAMGFAFSQSALVIVAFFLLVGLGLAAPFLLIAFVPAMYKILPPPGAWMDTFKQLMGFTLVATTMWLLYVLSAQVSLAGTLGFVAFLAVLGLGCWIYGHFGGVAASMGRQLAAFAAAAAIVTLAGFLLLDFGGTAEVGALFELPPLALSAVILVVFTAAMVLFGIVPVPGIPKAGHEPSPAGTGVHIGGFVLLGVASGLLYTFAALTSPNAALGLVGFSGALAAGLWFVGHFANSSVAWRMAGWANAIVVVAAGAWYFEVWNPGSAAVDSGGEEGGIEWQDFNDDRMASVLGRYRESETDVYYAGKPLFIDFTAEWCLTCKVNEKTVIETAIVEQAMHEHDVVPLKGDWTNHNENITSWLSCYGRAGVPYYVVLPADPSQPAIPLGEAVTTSSIIEAIEKASGKAASQEG